MLFLLFRLEVFDVGVWLIIFPELISIEICQGKFYLCYLFSLSTFWVLKLMSSRINLMTIESQLLERHFSHKPSHSMIRQQ